MAAYFDEEGRLNITVPCTAEAAADFQSGKRRLIALPCEWKSLVPKVGAPRGPQAGDLIGLFRPPAPRVRMTQITSVRQTRPSELTSEDYVGMGRQEDGTLDGVPFQDTWNQAWGDWDEAAWGPEPPPITPPGALTFDWSRDPEIFIIEWEAIQPPPPDPHQPHQHGAP